MSLTALALETPPAFYARLMAARRGDPIEESLARILASWFAGVGVMPNWLGLEADAFQDMMCRHFPGFDTEWMVESRRPLDAGRMPEMEDLRNLLVDNRTGRCESEIWMVDIVVAGCLGSDHLWQDLGLWNRADLSKLMTDNFWPLAKRNVKDMKWKKFLYKQLCETEGIYVCRAPSCEVCADYQACFGPEE